MRSLGITSGAAPVRWRLGRYGPLLDGVLAILLTVFLLAGSVGEANALHNGTHIRPGPGAPGYALVVVACLVLIWRRRWPLTTFGISLGAVLVYTGLGFVDGAALVAPMIGLYTVTVTGSARRALILGAVTFVSLTSVDMAFEPFGPTGGSVPVVPFEVALTVFVGLAVAGRRAYVAEIQDRAERAERTREEEARRRVDAERLRIARELHDVVAHTISVINIQVRVAAQVIHDPPEAGANALAAIKDASLEAMRELRGILGLLRQADDETAPTTPAPGLDELDSLASATSGAGMPVKVTVTGEPFRLPAAVDVAAYRIVQESLTNALRHAGPAAAQVSIRYGMDKVTIEVVDDGRGPAAVDGPPSAGGGQGIVGMRERVAAVGGTLEAGPRHDGGFRVRACLPAVIES